MAKSLRTALAVAFRFLRGRRGGATGFAAAAVVMMLLGGGALISDHVWLVGKRDLLRSAAAAASVATTQRLATLPGSMTDAEVHAALLPVAERYARLNVLANIGKELEPDDVTVVLAVDRDAGTVDVRVSADIGDTLLSKWLYDYGGPGDMEARAGVEQARSPAEVVLAIDTTSSMGRGFGLSGSRLEAVKDAATDLVEILQPSQAGSVAVAIVPWTTMVRLDSATRARWHTEGWAAFPDRRRYRSPHGGNNPTPVVQDIPRSLRGTWRGCLAAARMQEGIADIPARSDALDLPTDGAFAEAYSLGRFGTVHRCFGADEAPDDFTWQFCWDRDSAEGNGRVALPARQQANTMCADISPLMPLSTDRRAIDRAIADLSAPGAATQSALGVQWGRRLLSSEWRDVWGGAVHPVDPSDPDHVGMRKVLVLLTDGEDNFCGRNDPNCESGAAERRSLACEDAKAEGIEVFVVAAMHPSNVSNDLATSLRTCASSSAHAYINNPNAQALRDAFSDIATRVSTLRRVY